MKIICTLLLVISFVSNSLSQCNTFFPLKENVRYEYELFDKKEKMTARMSHTMKNISGSGENMNATLAQELYDPKSGDKVSSSELDWTCKDGVLHFDMKSMNLMMDNAQQMNMGDAGMSLEVTGDELDLPSELEVGQTFKDVSYNIKMTMGTLTLMNKTFTVKERKVEKQENLTTPAGTFDCYKVTFTTTDEKGKHSSESAVWYAKDSGMIKTENYNKDGKVVNSQVLVKLTK
jgi:hypothetical protein